MRLSAIESGIHQPASSGSDPVVATASGCSRTSQPSLETTTSPQLPFQDQPPQSRHHKKGAVAINSHLDGPTRISHMSSIDSAITWIKTLVITPSPTARTPLPSERAAMAGLATPSNTSNTSSSNSNTQNGQPNSNTDNTSGQGTSILSLPAELHAEILSYLFLTSYLDTMSLMLALPSHPQWLAAFHHPQILRHRYGTFNYHVLEDPSNAVHGVIEDPYEPNSPYISKNHTIPRRVFIGMISRLVWPRAPGYWLGEGGCFDTAIYCLYEGKDRRLRVFHCLEYPEEMYLKKNGWGRRPLKVLFPEWERIEITGHPILADPLLLPGGAERVKKEAYRMGYGEEWCRENGVEGPWVVAARITVDLRLRFDGVCLVRFCPCGGEGCREIEREWREEVRGLLEGGLGGLIEWGCGRILRESGAEGLDVAFKLHFWDRGYDHWELMIDGRPEQSGTAGKVELSG